MSEIFLKKYWEEGEILFYMHFQDGWAQRQIEISPEGTKFLSLVNWKKGGPMLYDGKLDKLELDGNEFIAKEEFEKAWSQNPEPERHQKS